jgi:hypothetical protein
VHGPNNGAKILTHERAAAGRQVKMQQRKPPRQSLAYLMRRALEERRAARGATCCEARIAHRNMARHYAAEAWAVRSAERATTSGPARVE